MVSPTVSSTARTEPRPPTRLNRPPSSPVEAVTIEDRPELLTTRRSATGPWLKVVRWLWSD